MKKLEADGSYNIEKVREFIVELDKVLAQKPKPVIDSDSAHIMIRNLIESLRYSVDTIEFMSREIQLTQAMYSGSGSNAKN